MAAPIANVGAIVIGRNEGERLKRCLASLSAVDTVVYVDSGSTDGSAQWAEEHGIEVVALDMDSPFTAAPARNAGFRRLQEIAPNVEYIQFVDGDCELVDGWLAIANPFSMHIPTLPPSAVAGASASRIDRSTTGCVTANGTDPPGKLKLAVVT